MKPNHELVEQLSVAGDSLVRAVVQLRPTDKSAGDHDFSALARQVLDRVAQTVGHAEKRINVLKHVESIVLESDPKFIRELIKQP